MKKIFKILFLSFLISGSIISANEIKAQSVSVSLSVFQNSLSPYGRWMNNGTYGQVWVSNDRNFVPYSTGGHWAYTDYGWTWVSDYDWGWAPFHYGRWNFENGTGWYWVPGYDWAPAWVAWRGGGDYYGWAPLSPGLNVSVGVSWGNQIPYDRWVFAPHRYITSPNIGRYYVPRTQNVTIIKRTTIVNNTVVKNNVHFVAGPRRTDVERINHSRVQTYTIANSSRPGRTVVNKNTINVYRPVINKTTVNQNHNETVINNNKTTVNKNSNNTTVNKNSNNTTVKKTTINKNNNNQTVKENNNTVNKPVVNNNKTVTKKQSQQPKPQPKADNKSIDQPQANNNSDRNRQQVVKPNRNIDNKPQVTNKAPVLKPNTPARPQPKAPANNDNKKPDHQQK